MSSFADDLKEALNLLEANGNPQTDPPTEELTYAISPNASAPKSKRVTKRRVSLTWRKKKLAALSSASRPSSFGDYGNLGIGALEANLTEALNNDDLSMHECTYLGNCTCADCR
jgi:hypothetical protein